MTKFYKQIKDGLYGEVGHIYIEDDNIIVPSGFVGCVNAMTPDSYQVVFPEDMVERINELEYKAIEQADYVDEQPTRENPRAKEARQYLAYFKQAASDLSEIWSELSFHEVELAGLNENYPFERSFDEYDFSSWGEIPDRSPIEETVDYLNLVTEGKQYSYLLEDTDEKNVIKTAVIELMIRRAKALSLEEEEEIDRLIENL